MPRFAERHGTAENHLLAALPDEEYERLPADLRHVTLSLGEFVYESGDHLDHIHFPTSF